MQKSQEPIQGQVDYFWSQTTTNLARDKWLQVQVAAKVGFGFLHLL